jgi:hypothetical protein
VRDTWWLCRPHRLLQAEELATWVKLSCQPVGRLVEALYGTQGTQRLPEIEGCC